MRQTSSPRTNPHIPSPHTKGYVPWPDGTLRDFSVYNMSWAWTADDINSTTHDINDFYTALLTGRLLRPAQLTDMLTTVPQNPADPGSTGIGLGIARAQIPCGTVWGHSGGGFGYGTHTLRSADGSRQVTLAENMTLYATPGTAHPIDTARTQFHILALCGRTTPTRSAVLPIPPSGLH